MVDEYGLGESDATAAGTANVDLYHTAAMTQTSNLQLAAWSNFGVAACVTLLVWLDDTFYQLPSSWRNVLPGPMWTLVWFFSNVPLQLIIAMYETDRLHHWF